MFVYKKLKASDVSKVPFNAHKSHSYSFEGRFHTGSDGLNTFTSKSGIVIYSSSRFQGAQIAQGNMKTIDSMSMEMKRFRQLNHLYFRNYPSQVASTTSDVDYFYQNRYFTEENTIASIPQDLWGVQIKPRSFTWKMLEGASKRYKTMIVDDGYGNLWEAYDPLPSGFGSGIINSPYMMYTSSILLHSSASTVYSASVNFKDLTDPNKRIFSLEPKNAWSNPYHYMNVDEYNKEVVNPTYNNLNSLGNSRDYDSHFLTFQSDSLATASLWNKEWIYDDSYFRNLLQYKDIWIGPSTMSIYGEPPVSRTESWDPSHPKFAGDVPFSNMGHYVTKNGYYNKHNLWGMGFMGRHMSESNHGDGTLGENVGLCNDTGSYIKSPHNEKFNFNPGDDFTITFLYNRYYDGPAGAVGDAYLYGGNQNKVALIGKSTTKTIVAPPTVLKGGGTVNLSATGSAQEHEVPSAPQFPFEINLIPSKSIKEITAHATATRYYYQIEFARSDGDNTVFISSSLESYGVGSAGNIMPSDAYPTNWIKLMDAHKCYNQWIHVACRYSSSIMQIFVQGIESGTSASDMPTQNNLLQGAWSASSYDLKMTQNNANLYIGSKGGKSNFFEGQMSSINIYNYGLSDTDIRWLSGYGLRTNDPRVGNIFYDSGMAVITNPLYSQRFHMEEATHSINFQGTLPLYENEYQCTIDEQEFNYTNNITTKKIKTEEGQEIEDFTTSSLFQPFITTIGLYNEENELLVVGKLGQPVRTSYETDTTFVLRWDT